MYCDHVLIVVVVSFLGSTLTTFILTMICHVILSHLLFVVNNKVGLQLRSSSGNETTEIADELGPQMLVHVKLQVSFQVGSKVADIAFVNRLRTIAGMRLFPVMSQLYPRTKHQGAEIA